MDVASGSGPSFDNGYFPEPFLAHLDAPVDRLFHAKGVTHGEIATDPRADEFTADGALENTVVEGQDTLKGALVLPSGEDAANTDPFVLHMDGHGDPLAVRIIHLGNHVTDVVCVEIDPLVVPHAFRVGCAPQQGGSLHAT